MRGVSSPQTGAEHPGRGAVSLRHAPDCPARNGGLAVRRLFLRPDPEQMGPHPYAESPEINAGPQLVKKHFGKLARRPRKRVRSRVLRPEAVVTYRERSKTRLICGNRIKEMAVRHFYLPVENNIIFAANGLAPVSAACDCEWFVYSCERRLTFDTKHNKVISGG